ncbi:MAG: Gfo/Idh/MocA family protein [Chloroflexota bacterium]|jgi:UDP-N-acetylglucosamine 3-dehydrogenase|nr:Gfo/Idh/MocA family oxidoreductase [Chloroflexota bacterium]
MAGQRSLALGLIGCGTMGGSHATQLVSLADAHLVVACDLDITKAEAVVAQAAAAGHVVRATSNLADVLADPEVGGVIVATPNFTHRDVVMQALEAGKDVFCEKPMALTLADCDAMIARAHELGRKLMVGQVLRLITVFATVRRLVAEGVIGKPFAVRIIRCARRSLDGPWAATWRSKRANTGGLLHEVNVHEFDFMRSIFGEVESVAAMSANFTRPEYDYEDHVIVTLSFRNGGLGVLESSVATAIGATDGLITGERGSISYDWARNSVRYRLLDGTEEDVPVERDLGRSVQGELSSFARWVLHNEAPVVTAEDGRRAVQLAEAAYQSIAERRTITLA